MLANGLQPTPIDFYKMISLDEKLQDFFCYCNRKEEFYDFEVISFHQKNNSEYLTVSKRGLIHFLKEEPHFMSINEWEREANIYRSMKKL